MSENSEEFDYEDEQDFTFEELHGLEPDPEADPFSNSTNTAKAYPLEKAVRAYCRYFEVKHKIPFRDLTKERNFKKRKGERVVDFILENLAAIEVKNWNCVTKKYQISITNVKEEMLVRFNKYSEKFKIVIISDPVWLARA
jgi:hypothetical protein